MTLIRWHQRNPLGDMMSNLFENELGDFFGKRITDPAANIVEQSDSFMLEIAAPGLKKDDFKIHLENSVLTISAQIEDDKKEEGNDGRYGNDSKEKQIQLKAGRESSTTNVSNSKSKRTRKNDQGLWESFGGINGREGTNVSNSNNSRDRTSTHGINKDGKKKIERWEEFSQLKFSGHSKETWWQTESRICGVPNGVSFELDKTRSNRIKSLGNSIVPQIVRELGFAILEAEKNT